MNFEQYKNNDPWPSMSMCLDRDTLIRLRVSWMEKQDLLYNQFKEDLATELGLVGHPKWEDLFFMLAWDEGHSKGFVSVYEWAKRLSILLDKDNRPERVENLRRMRGR